MRVHFLGAAQTVTGSMHLVEGAEAKVLLDCGLYQGRRGETIQRNQHLPFEPRELDAVVLSHAHIDHSGALPMLPGRGFRGTIIPTFALERAQEIILSLRSLSKKGEIPSIPVIVDSPLAVKVTEVFRMHPDCYDQDLRAQMKGGHSPFEFDHLRYVSDVEESKAVSADKRPMVILAGSGMCESGRVLHHLRTAVEEMWNTVVIVGFQAQHTLGRRLVEKRTKVKIYGVERDRRCEVQVLNGFSAHAGQDELIGFVHDIRKRGGVGRVALVHGEPAPQRTLQEKLTVMGQENITIPAQGDVMEF